MFTNSSHLAYLFVVLGFKTHEPFAKSTVLHTSENRLAPGVFAHIRYYWPFLQIFFTGNHIARQCFEDIKGPVLL
jgi:hypothetical protein